jgi:DNA repair exonuclease SbcCD nuclease subunit
VYGCAFTSDTETRPVLENFHVKDESRINILALHCDLDVKDSYYCPVTQKQLSESGVDYAALGHIHKGTDVLSLGEVKYAYSGCLEGRSFGETGIKGAICGEIEKGNISLKRVRFCSKRYEKLEIDVTGAQSISDCADKVIKAGSEYSDDTMLRVTFTGITSEGFSADVKLVKKMLPNVFYVEVADETAPLLNLASLKEDKTLAGEFYRCLEEKLLSEDEETRKTANNALKYGLRAIKGMEIGLDD